ncbi:pilus assembly flp-type cpab [Trichococcus palustris]|uniref:Pilus assembly flp-type cpab n=1 Tax=Trichococcus palustris TaxID=140314 RepID=A0A143Y4X6_9LACT|nr:Flp pilus assembly protein CpaB [Trichococcus palustris]CZQ80859.1 pilus assembly flp-type cpab [Trichococcus palustris]SFK63739.1 pilus assembly protein CpaB [Trichococcus palustris]
MKTKKRIWIITAILALITTGMVYFYLGQVEAASQENKAAMSEVVVAISTVPAHVKVTEEMLEIKKIPTEAVHADTYTSIADVVGGTTTTALIAGEQVLTDRIVTDTGDSPLAYQIPENMRAVTVPTTETSGIGGYIMPGDSVDVLVNYTPSADQKVVMTQLQNIKILEKGPYTTGTEGQQTGIPTSLTLLVTPAQAEVIAYAAVNGTFYFTLRNVVDTVKQELPNYGTANFDSWKER